MTQLVVEIEDPSVVANIKKAISMLRGVSKVHVKKNVVPNAQTRQAIHEIETGDTIKCSSFEDYLDKVKE